MSRDQQNLLPSSESFAWDQNEEHTKCGVDEGRNSEHHDCAACKKLADIRFPHPSKVERGVLAEADKGEDGVERILIRGETVYPDCEGENELYHNQQQEKCTD